MRSLQRIFAILLLVATGFAAQAQYCGPTICTPGTNMPAPGFSPPADSVPCAVKGVAYAQTVQVKMPNTVVSGGTTYKLKNIRIDSVGNLPCGLCWATSRANNTFDSSEQFCLKVSGITYDNPGQFKLNILVTATVYIGIGTLTTSQAANATAAGLNYWVRVQALGGPCTPIDTLAAGNTSLAIGAVPSNAVTAGGPTTFCTGGSVTFTATEAAATAYQWFNGSTAIVGATSRTYTATTAGSYTVYIEKGCHGVTSSAQVVTVNAAPTVSVTPAGPVVKCTGSTQVLTATTSGGTLTWSNGAGVISGQTATTYTASATGTYFATATQNGCPANSNSVSIQFTGTPPTPTITPTSATVCAGATDTLDAGAGYTTYAWSGALGTAQKAYPVGAGTYTVTVTNGVCSGSASINITLRANATTPTVTPAGPVAICSGSSTTLTSSAASVYNWSNGLHTQAITVTTAGSYTVTVSNTNQCGTAASTPVTVTVTTAPVAGVTPAGPVIICGSGSQVLTASGGGTYQWLKNSAPIVGQTAGTYTATTAGNYSVIATVGSCFDTSNVVSVQIGSALSPTITANHTYICTGATDTLDVGSGYSSYAWSNSLGSTRFAYPTSAGTYTVTVTNGACSGTATVTITARGATPTPTITAGGPTTFCTGGSVLLTSSSATGNVWSNAATTQSVTATTGGSYTVTNNNGCGAATSTATVVTVNTIPNAQITPSGSTIICGGSTQTLTATPAGATYVWQQGGSPIGGQTSATYDASTSGTYNAVVTVNGCSATSNTATITVSGTPPTPTITATAQTLCPGAIDTLNVGAGYTSYAWSGALGTNSTATVTTGGTYTVTVHNGVCVGSATITINQGSGSVAPTIAVTGSLHLCGTDSVVLTSSSATGNQWSNSSTSQSITVNSPGVFYVTVNGQCGSATSLSDTVTQNSFPAVELGADTGTCAGDTLRLDAGVNGTSYSWSTGATTAVAITTTTAEYYVSVTKDGCTSTDSVHVTFDAVPTATFTQAAGVLTASAGTSYVWKKNGGVIPGATSQTYDANPSGTANYSVVVTVGYCSATSAPQLVTILGISDLSQSMNTNIYPNPANSSLNIEYTLARNESIEVYLTDVTGRTVNNLYSGTQADGDHSIVTDLAGLTGGVYFVNFRTAEGTVVRKVVKQ
jgi:hypothetical protein